MDMQIEKSSAFEFLVKMNCYKFVYCIPWHKYAFEEIWSYKSWFPVFISFSDASYCYITVWVAAHPFQHLYCDHGLLRSCICMLSYYMVLVEMADQVITLFEIDVTVVLISLLIIDFVLFCQVCCFIITTSFRMKSIEVWKLQQILKTTLNTCIIQHAKYNWF